MIPRGVPNGYQQLQGRDGWAAATAWQFGDIHPEHLREAAERQIENLLNGFTRQDRVSSTSSFSACPGLRRSRPDHGRAARQRRKQSRPPIVIRR